MRHTGTPHPHIKSQYFPLYSYVEQTLLPFPSGMHTPSSISPQEYGKVVQVDVPEVHS